MAKATICGVMGRRTRGSGRKTKLMGSALMFGLMAGSLLATGKTTICTARVSTLGRTGASMTGSIKMIGSMGLGCTFGKTVVLMKAFGRMASSTEKAYIDNRICQIAEGVGRMANELNG